MFRLFCAGAIALGSVGMAVAASPASAEPLCTSVSTTGAGGSHTVGPACVPYPLAAECSGTTVNGGVFVTVTEHSCVPAP
jgi:hypothetical protein